MKLILRILVCGALVLCMMVQPFAAWRKAGVAPSAGAVTDVTVKMARAITLDETASARIAGIVWDDANGDGRMDNSENVLSGVQVRLLVKSGDADTLCVDEADAQTDDGEPSKQPGDADGASVGDLPTVDIGGANSDPVAEPAPETQQDAQATGRVTGLTPEIIELTDEDVPLADGYAVLMSTVSDSNGWYSFTGLAPGRYVVAVAGLGENMSATKKRSDHSVIDPGTLRSCAINIKKDTSRVDNMHIGVSNKDVTAAGSDETIVPEAVIAPEASDPSESMIDPLAIIDPEAAATAVDAASCECRDEGGICAFGEDCDCGCHDVEDRGDAAARERGVAIFSTLSDVIAEGDPITLSSKLTGYDGLEVSYQWQYKKEDAAWADMAGATGGSFTFAATPENVRYEWRLLVSFDD